MTKEKVLIPMILVLVIIVGIMVISLYVGNTLMHPKRVVPTMSKSQVLKYNEVSFNSLGSDISLKGWYFISENSDKAIIMAHGYGENRLQFKEKTFNMISALNKKGYNVLSFDFRNSGISQGDLTTIGICEKQDLKGALAYVKSLGVKHIILYGVSMGAATSLVTASETKDVDAVIADSSFSDLKEYLENNLSVWSGLPNIPFTKTILFTIKTFKGLDISEFSPKQAITKIAPRPILFIHGKNDPSIPVDNSIEMYQNYSKIAGKNAFLWETDADWHPGSYSKNPTEYINKMYKFLDYVSQKK